MLEIIEDPQDKIALQKQFNRLLAAEWGQREKRRVRWRPDYQDFNITHNGRYWFVSVKPDREQTIKRFWTSFGVYHPKEPLFITVEINVATESNAHSVSGFFVRDPETGDIYLMHDGGVGGGKKGVGRSLFLHWSKLKLDPAEGSDGRLRFATKVARLSKGGVGKSVSDFIQIVADFKQAVDNGQVPTGAAAEKIEKDYKNYQREFSGKKRAKRARDIEYITHHGDVVDELTRWRPARKTKGERLVKNSLIDLGIEVNKELSVLFEVKTGSSRQHLYTAIGQLMVHGRGKSKLQRYVVIPHGERVVKDIANALDMLGIDVLRYALNGDKVTIIEPKSR